MIKRLLKSAVVFFVILGVSFSNVPFYALSGLIDSYEKSSGIVDKIALLERSHGNDVVDNFSTLRNISEKLRVMEAMAAAPTFVNKGAFASGVGALTVAVPAAYADNDVFLLFVESANEAIATPAGWTQVTNSPQFTGSAAAIGGVRLGIFYKVVTGAQSSVSVADTGNHTTAIIMGFRGVDTATPVNISAGAVSAATTAMSLPSVTTTVVDTFVVLAAAMDTDAASTATVTGWANASLTGIVEQHDQTVASGVGGGLAIATGVKATAGSTGATTATGSTSVTHAYLTIALKPAPPATTITNFVSAEPGNSTIAPAGSGLVDSFGLATNTGIDTVTGATVGLAVGTGARIATVAITNDGNTVTYCSATPSGDVATLTGCGIPVTTTNTQFKIKITAISHASMPAPPGGSYAVTATITAYTSTNAQAGTDSGSSTLTIDNASPNGATSVSGTAGTNANTINWTTSNSADFDTTNGSVVLRWASGTAGAEVPAEGNSTYTAGNTITTATVACVISSAASTAQSKVDGTGGSAGCTTTALTNGQAYTYKVFQRDTNGNYDAGVTIGTFTPAAAITVTSYANSTEPALDYAGACTGCGARVGGGAGFRQSITITGSGFGADPGVGFRSTASDNIKIGTHQIVTTNVTAWSATSITFLTDSNVAGDTDTDWGTNFGGASALVVTAGGAGATGLNFYVFPQVTSLITCNKAEFPVGDGAREYDATDSACPNALKDGQVKLVGTRFGTAVTSGYVRILGCDVTTCASPAGTVNIDSWANELIQIQIPPVIADTVNTGSLVMQQGTGSNNKTHTYTTTNFRIYPRIISNTATTEISGNKIKILGNHFCQSGSCPVSPNRSTVADNVIFGATKALESDFVNTGTAPCSGNAQAWIDTEICVKVPAGLAVGSHPTKVTSNTSYTSNTMAFTVPSTIPNDPVLTVPKQYKSDGTTVITHMTKTNETTVILKADITASLTIDMALQVEVDPTGAGFNGVGIIQGTVGGGGACTACTTLANAQVTVSGLTEGDKQWRARVINTTTLETSGWVYYVNPSTAEVDFTVDTTAPIITFSPTDTCSGGQSNLGTNGVTISWGLNELSTGQVEYSTDSNLAGSTLFPSSPAAANTSHAIILSNLSSGTTYYFKVKSQDSVGNLATRPTANPYCTFTTGSNLSPAKTTRFHIVGATSTLPLSQSFTVVMPENATTTKSIFVEIKGVYVSGASSKDVVVQVNAETAKTYILPPSSTSYFKIIHPVSAIAVDPGTNTLTITPQANTTLYILSADIYVNYAYTP